VPKGIVRQIKESLDYLGIKRGGGPNASLTKGEGGAIIGGGTRSLYE